MSDTWNPTDICDLTDGQLVDGEARLMRLVTELRDAGPDHFNQEVWFTAATGTLLDLDYGVTSELLAAFDIGSCGTAACLAGHGALVIAGDRAHDPGYGIAVDDVAIYFNISRAWFTADLERLEEHPFYELRVDLARAGTPVHVADWVVQLAAIDERARHYRGEMMRRRETSHAHA